MWINHLFSILIGYFVILPLASFLIIFNALVRLVLSFLLQIFHPEFQLISSGTDNIVHHHHQIKMDGAMNILLLFSPSEQFKGMEAEVEEFREKVFYNKDYDKLKKIVSKKWGYGCWKECNFNLNRHIKLGKNLGLTEAKLMGKLLPDYSKMIEEEEGRPQWEWIVFPRVSIKGCPFTVRIFRFHHAYMDSHAAANLFRYRIFPSEINTDILGTQNNSLTQLEGLSKLRVCAALPLSLIRAGAKQRMVKRDPFLLSDGSSGHHNFSSSGSIATSYKDQRRYLDNNSLFVTALAESIGKITEAQENGLENGDALHINFGIPEPVYPYPFQVPINRTSILFANFEPAKSPTVEVPNQDLEFFSNYLILCILGKFPLKIIQQLLKDGAGISTLFGRLQFGHTPGYFAGSEITDVKYFSSLPPPHGISVTAVEYKGKSGFNFNSSNSVFSAEENQLLANELIVNLEKNLAEKVK